MVQKYSFIKLESYINRVSTNFVNQVLESSKDEIRDVVIDRISDAIDGSLETESIKSGQLRAELGLENPEAKIAGLITAIKNSFDVKVSSSPRNSRGRTVTIRGINADYSELVEQPFAKQVTKTGQILDWLRWLVFEGRKIIVKEYFFSSNRGIGRSGLPAKMIKSQRGRSGWRVPPENAGTISNNFITRSVQNIGPSLQRNVGRIITRNANIAAARLKR